MNKKALQYLVCPKCYGPLVYQRKHNELVCHADALAFPVRRDTPILLAQDARRLTQLELAGN